MEALLILFANLISAVAGAAAGVLYLIIIVISLGVKLLISAFFWLTAATDKDVYFEPAVPHSIPGTKKNGTDRSGRPVPALPPGPVQNPRFPSWSKYILWILSGLALVTLVGLVLIETVFFDQTVRWIANKQSADTGVQVSFETVSGSFLKRHISFQNLQLYREAEGENAGFNLAAHKVEGSFDGALISRPKSMGYLRIHGTRGTVSLPESSKQTRPESRGLSLEIVLQRKAGFTVKELEALDAEIQFYSADETFIGDLIISEWRSAPLRSRHMAFDLLFRSNVTASFGETDIQIATSGEKDARQTHWRFSRIPLPLIANLLGPPWDILQDGKTSLEIHDEWSLADGNLFVDSNWSILLQDLSLKPDQSDSILSRFRQSAAANILRRRIEQQGGLEIRFTIRIEDGSLSGSMNGLLRDLIELAKENSASRNW